MQLLNQYSYVLISLALFLGSVAAAALWFPGTVGLMAVLLVLVGLLAVGLALRYQDDDTGSTPPDALIGKGLPVLLAVYSNL